MENEASYEAIAMGLKRYYFLFKSDDIPARYVSLPEGK